MVLTLLGLLFPGMSAALAIATTGSQTIIICTGDGLKTITIDADGKSSVELRRETPCLLAHAADTAKPVPPGQPLAAPFATVAGAFGGRIAPTEDRPGRPRPRAPPSALGA